MDYVTSDQHFGHRNIIEYEQRPFKDVSQMSNILIRKWNGTVSKSDKVFVLGDFSFFPFSLTHNILSCLNGHKILICGNHDKGRSANWWKRAGFDEVYRYPIVYKRCYIFSHEPVYIDSSSPFINIHGHLHGQIIDNDNYINIGVDQMEFSPVSVDSLRKKDNEVRLLELQKGIRVSSLRTKGV